jgi:hypothetical protein
MCRELFFFAPGSNITCIISICDLCTDSASYFMSRQHRFFFCVCPVSSGVSLSSPVEAAFLVVTSCHDCFGVTDCALCIIPGLEMEVLYCNGRPRKIYRPVDQAAASSTGYVEEYRRTLR